MDFALEVTMEARRRRSCLGFAWEVPVGAALSATVLARPCFADSLGTSGEAQAILAGLILMGAATVVFVLLALLLWRPRAGVGRVRRVVAFATMALAALWYAASLSLIVLGLGSREPGTIALYCLVGGAPAHLAALAALLRGRRLVRPLRPVAAG
jgi:hypothetical protein